MSLNYTVLYTDLGKLIKHYDLQKTDGTNLGTDLDEILDAFQDEGTLASRDLPIDGLTTDFEGWESEYADRRATLADYAGRRLQDRETVMVELGAVSSDLGEILPRLVNQMFVDSSTVNASSVSLGSSTAASGNTGNGTVVSTKVLDAVTSPGQLSGVTFPAHRRNASRDTELAAPSETMSLECVADSYADGLTEGQEQFRWSGGVPINKHGIDSEGSGDIGFITAIHAGSLLSNLDFETFTVANTPDSWTIDAGTAGTHIFQQTAGANVYHGSSSLKFLGDGSQASMQVSQAPTSLQAGRSYAVTARVKADSTIAAGALTIQFEGTGYSASSAEKISVAAGSLPTSYTLYSFVVSMPDDLPSDMKLVVKWTGTPTNAKSLWIDDIGFSEVNYGGGVGAIVVRGSTPFVRGDKITFTVANTEGVIQRFFRRVFGYQLASDNAAGETISDSLAT